MLTSPHVTCRPSSWRFKDTETLFMRVNHIKPVGTHTQGRLLGRWQDNSARPFPGKGKCSEKWTPSCRPSTLDIIPAWAASFEEMETILVQYITCLPSTYLTVCSGIWKYYRSRSEINRIFKSSWLSYWYTGETIYWTSFHSFQFVIIIRKAFVFKLKTLPAIGGN